MGTRGRRTDLAFRPLSLPCLPPVLLGPAPGLPGCASGIPACTPVVPLARSSRMCAGRDPSAAPGRPFADEIGCQAMRYAFSSGEIGCQAMRYAFSYGPAGPQGRQQLERRCVTWSVVARSGVKIGCQRSGVRRCGMRFPAHRSGRVAGNNARGGGSHVPLWPDCGHYSVLDDFRRKLVSICGHYSGGDGSPRPLLPRPPPSVARRRSGGQVQ